MNLAHIRDAYIDEGLSYENASARACQEAFLTMVAQSGFAQKVTFKGGVLMQQVSGDKRRATQDIDFDFMRYSIDDESIALFISKLNKNNDNIRLQIDGPIEELKHQAYSGKPVHVIVSDGAGNSLKTKLDIGVHRNLDISQREICFDVHASDEGMSLLANSDEQLVAEKLKSLLRLGARSIRYKDVFDIYYQIVVKGVDFVELDKCMKAFIFDDETMRELDWPDVYQRLKKVFGDRRFVRGLSGAKNNWLEIPAKKVTEGIMSQVRKYGR